MVGEPCDRGGDAVLEAGARLVADELPGTPDVGEQPRLGVPPPDRGEHRAGGIADGGIDHVGEITDAHLPSRAEVELHAGDLWGEPGMQQRLAYVRDIGE